jgi:putative ABC transport system permease protein
LLDDSFHRVNDFFKHNQKHPKMLSNYLKIAWRNLLRNRVYSAINIGGLALGMAVAVLIGLWIHDELTFDRSFANYDRLGQVYMYQTFSGQRGPQDALPIALADELRRNFPDLQEVALSSWGDEHILAVGDQKLLRQGNAVEPQFTRMFSLRMQRGIQDGLHEVRSIMLSALTASALFGTTDPVGKLVRIDGKNDLTVTGVYEDLPANTSLYNGGSKLEFLTPLAYFAAENDWFARSSTVWDDNSWPIFVQLAGHARFNAVSAKIKQVVANKRGAEGRPYQPELTLLPMRDWHLRSLFDKARGGAGQIQFVWLFGLIGAFVLLLACINFMNLSTARSEKRAKEVGIRKAVGSQRGQVAGQFLTESSLMVGLAFGGALVLASLALPWFNTLANKAMQFPWHHAEFWVLCVCFIVGTSLLAGSYPALFLSGFQPIQVLKGRLVRQGGQGVLTPRKVLVVVQFTVSLVLIIGTMVVYRQIQFAKDRPVGYDRSGLITMTMNTPEIRQNYDRLRADLLLSGAVLNMAESQSPITSVWSNTSELLWPGKDPANKPVVSRTRITHDFGQTVGFQFVAGRDFSRAFPSDSSGIILNESAVKAMGLKQPIGALITENNRTFHVVGVVKDLLMQSPYDPIRPAVFMLSYTIVNVITIRLKPTVATADALSRVAAVFQKHNPNAPFDYQFVDAAFAQKFDAETRIGTLSGVFAGLAILISCLGLFGLASFMAEQRTKEIGIRKVLGASVLHLWGLLSKEFIAIVGVAFLLAVPLTIWGAEHWLRTYTYKTTLPWWLFALAGTLAVGIALVTVSFQSIRAALMNPVKSLRSE